MKIEDILKRLEELAKKNIFKAKEELAKKNIFKAKKVKNELDKGNFDQAKSMNVGSILKEAKMIGFKELFQVNQTFISYCNKMKMQKRKAIHGMGKKEKNGVKQKLEIMHDEFFKKLNHRYVKSVKALDRYRCPKGAIPVKNSFICKGDFKKEKHASWTDDNGKMWLGVWKHFNMYHLNDIMLKSNFGPRVIDEHSRSEKTFATASFDAGKNLGMILRKNNLKSTDVNYWYKQGFLYYYAGINVPIRCDGCAALAFYHLVNTAVKSAKHMVVAIVEQGNASTTGHWWILLSNRVDRIGWDSKGYLYPKQYVVDLWYAHRKKYESCILTEHIEKGKLYYQPCGKNNKKTIRCAWKNFS